MNSIEIHKQLLIVENIEAEIRTIQELPAQDVFELFCYNNTETTIIVLSLEVVTETLLYQEVVLINALKQEQAQLKQLVLKE